MGIFSNNNINTKIPQETDRTATFPIDNNTDLHSMSYNMCWHNINWTACLKNFHSVTESLRKNGMAQLL